MKKHLKSFIKTFDFFSVNIGFNVNRKEEYGTSLGGVVFFLYFIVTIYFIMVNFLSFTDRSIFNQNTISSTYDYSPPLDLLNNNLAFAFGITIDKAMTQSYASLIDISLNHVTLFKANNSKVKTPLLVTQCTKAHFNNLINDSFDLMSLSQYHCIDKDKYRRANQSLIIKGLFTNDIFQYVEYSAKAGKEAELRVNSFQSLLQSHDVQLQFYYLDTSLNLSTFAEPHTLYLNSKYLTLSYPMVSKLNIDFSNNTFENDANILLRGSSIADFYTIANYEVSNVFIGVSRFEERPGDYDLFGRVYIRSSQQDVTIRRIYQKFTEFLADATSILSYLLLILSLVLSAHNKYRAVESIIDRMMTNKQKLKKKSPGEFQKMKLVLNYQLTQSCSSNSKFQRDKCSSPIIASSKISTRQSKFNHKSYESIKNFSSFNNYILPSEDQLMKGNHCHSQSQPLYYSFLPPSLAHSSQKNSLAKRNPSTLKYGCCDIIRFYLSKICIKSAINNKKKVYDKGMSVYVYNLDVFTYLSKMKEIELMRNLLFTRPESHLINFLSHPSIAYMYSELSGESWGSIEEFTYSKEKIKLVSQAFKNVYDDYEATKKKK